MDKILLMKKILFSLIILLAIIIIIIGVANVKVKHDIKKDIKNLETNSLNENTKIISLDDINNLPIPVKKWLISIGLINKKRMDFVSFSQKGKMKLTKDQESWYLPEAKQYVRIDEPSFLWVVDIKMMPFLNVKGIDSFKNGKGSMKMLLSSLIPVVNEKNNYKIDESSLSRFLLELPWYPSAALEDYIVWEALSDYSAKAIISFNGLNSEVIFYFDENYDLIKMEGLRYKESDENSKRITCIGVVKGHIIVDGIKVPNKINVSWQENDDIFTWYKIENFNYNLY